VKKVLGCCGCAAMSPVVALLAILVIAGGAVASVAEQGVGDAIASVLPIITSLLGLGGGPGCQSMCDVDPAGPQRVFAWVPVGGFPDSYPYGQCTYGAAYDFDPFPVGGHGGGAPENLGNGGDWYQNAERLGLPTLPPTVLPPVGAAVSYQGFPGATAAGHVAVVVYDDPDGAGYWIYEMNNVAIDQGTGITDIRHMTFPGDHLVGSIPAPQAEVATPSSSPSPRPGGG
jgi:surface antigen